MEAACLKSCVHRIGFFWRLQGRICLRLLFLSFWWFIVSLASAILLWSLSLSSLVFSLMYVSVQISSFCEAIKSCLSGLPLWLNGKRIHLPMQETQETGVWYLSQKDPPEEVMAMCSIFLPGDPIDREVWWATVHWVAKSQTRLSDWAHTQSYALGGTHPFFPGGLDGKEFSCNAGDLGLIPGLGRSPVEGHGNPLQYSYLENPHGQRILVDYSSWGHKELDRTEQLSTAQHRTQPSYSSMTSS